MPAAKIRAARAISYLALLALVGAGCSPSSSTPAQAERRDAAPAEATPDAEAPKDAAPVIASDEATFEFGSVSPSESVTHVFKLVNRGTADLHIEKVERT